MPDPPCDIAIRVRSAAVMGAARGPWCSWRGPGVSVGSSTALSRPSTSPPRKHVPPVVAGTAAADGEGMLWEIVMRADWRLMAVALPVGAFAAVVVLIWNGSRILRRIRTVEAQLTKMQNEITAVLQVQTALLTRLNVASRVETDRRDTAVEVGGGDVAGRTTLPPAASAQPESAKSATLPEQ